MVAAIPFVASHFLTFVRTLFVQNLSSGVDHSHDLPLVLAVLGQPVQHLW